ncbi:MAG: sterol desaturase family protein, partial [Lutibacter sp.]|nr:sterol desaturase family protein [Lutibacter sp.]
FAITVLIEGIVIFRKNKESYDLKDTFASLAMGTGNYFTNIVAKMMVLFVITLVYDQLRITTLSFAWWVWLVGLVIQDFCYYWFHRVSHESRFFWASHIVHHSSRKYNLSTALRQTWTGRFINFFFYLILPVLGFHPLMILALMSINLIYQYWIHTELIDKMPRWFEAVFNTPSHHRVHHGSNPLYLDRNHAGILIIWDKLFGTFQEELASEKVVYGLTKNIATYHPVKIAFDEWVAVFKDAFGTKMPLVKRWLYFVKAPGWRHDGFGIVSNDLREEWLREHPKKP